MFAPQSLLVALWMIRTMVKFSLPDSKLVTLPLTFVSTATHYKEKR